MKLFFFTVYCRTGPWGGSGSATLDFVLDLDLRDSLFQSGADPVSVPDPSILPDQYVPYPGGAGVSKK